MGGRCVDSLLAFRRACARCAVATRRFLAQVVVGDSVVPAPAEASGASRLQRLSRFAVLLGLGSVGATAVVAVFAYRATREQALRDLGEDSLSLARILARMTGERGDGGAVQALQRVWAETASRFPGRYLCVVGADGRLLLNTLRPDWEGTYVGDALVVASDGREQPLGQLVQKGEDLAGTFLARHGEKQVAAFAFSPALRGLVSVHVPARVVESQVRARVFPWAVSFGLTVAVLFPLSLGLLHRAYASSQRATRAALAALRDSQRGLVRAAQRLGTLREIDHAILAAESAASVADGALRLVEGLGPEWKASVAAWDPGSGELSVAAGEHAEVARLWAGALQSSGAACASVRTALASGKPVVVEDVLALGPSLPGAESLQVRGVRGCVLVPLLSRGALAGVLGFCAPHPGPPSGEQIEVAQEVARALAIGIEQARLRERLQWQAAQLEKQVAERTARLAAANRELEAFSYSVSHDLQAPLRKMHGFARVLLEDYAGALDEGGKRCVARIQNAAAEMERLIHALLDLSRLARIELDIQDVDLSGLATRIARDLQKTEPARRVRFEIASGLSARGDSRLLGIALRNLFENAFKYTRAVAEARIEFGAAHTAGGGRSEESCGPAVFFVRDNGAGFDMRYADKLFLPFSRLHSEGEFPGTGIGLATVQRIVERHGGRIWASGEPGQGASFYFTLGPAPA